MTGNQQRAVQLAEAIIAGTIEGAELPDADWALLLLAAELSLHSIAPRPLVVAHRVRARHLEQRGYFAAMSSSSRTPRVSLPLALNA